MNREQSGTNRTTPKGDEKARVSPFFSSPSQPVRQTGDSPTPTHPLRGVCGVGESHPPLPGLVARWGVVAESRDLRLFDLGDHSKSEWRRFKLVSKITRRKSNFHLAFNGLRLAMGSDAKTLEAHYPESFAWIVSVLHEVFHVGQ